MHVSIRLVLLALFLSLATACAHHVYSSKFSTVSWAPTGDKVEGVVYYEPSYVEITHTFTQRTDKDGKVTHGNGALPKCIPTIQKQEIVLMANLNEPRVILSKPGALASGQLKVTLTNGMLGGLEATSASQLPAFIESAGAVMAAALVPADEGNACNASPKISSFKLRNLE